jgi:light-regulated signal transduction histidine kinase (bacteriophytochrome)
MSALLDALLEYSRLGRTELRIAPTDLGAIVREATDRLAPWLEQAGAEVVIAPDLPRVPCDALRVGQVFGNLIANGVKYNTSPRKRIEIAARPGSGTPILCVRDNGIGIDPSRTGDIFKMFKRLHSGDAFGGGTGSGLAMAKKVVERHGGQIWVESRPGEGSTFCFTLAPAVAAGAA